MIDVIIEGNGVFGTFLRSFFYGSPFIRIVDVDADVVILAVPFDAFPEVCKKHAGKIMVNVCSIQAPSTRICLEHTKDVLGIHPLFGARTPNHMARTSLITHRADTQSGMAVEDQLCHAFIEAGSRIIDVTPEGMRLTGPWHDQLMALSHLKALEIAEYAAPILGCIEDIPTDYLPASVVKMRDLVDQLQDMPEGTRSSIKANEYG